MTTTIDLSVLRRQLDRVLSLLEQRHGSTVEFNADFYWLLETADMFSRESVPAPNAGQLSDDVAELTAMAARPDDELVPWHDLKHLIGLLEAVAHRDLP
ncbi:hypothetical protein ACRCUN_02425 [Mycobacterium sp. LTG2003]